MLEIDNVRIHIKPHSILEAWRRIYKILQRQSKEPPNLPSLAKIFEDNPTSLAKITRMVIEDIPDGSSFEAAKRFMQNKRHELDGLVIVMVWSKKREWYIVDGNEPEAYQKVHRVLTVRPKTLYGIIVEVVEGDPPLDIKIKTAYRKVRKKDAGRRIRQHTEIRGKQLYAKLGNEDKLRQVVHSILTD